MVHAVRCVALSAAAVLSALALATVARGNDTVPVKITAYPISHFRIGSDQAVFGPLEFIGGLELRGSADEFASMSGFRFLVPGRDFVGVTDEGFWYFGRVTRDDSGRPTGFADFSMQPITGKGGAAIVGKWQRDAEALEVQGTTATVGFEREHRIATFELADHRASPQLGTVDFLVPAYELRYNRGFETIAASPRNSKLAGARIAITEKSLDKNGNIFAAILDGPEKGIFKVARYGGFDITDGVFLADGDLLLLERSFSVAQGVKMRLRRIPLAEIREGRTVDGPILLQADLAYQIDNMEGLDAWLDDQGHQRIAMISDDNRSILQRNLYLEFRLRD